MRGLLPVGGCGRRRAAVAVVVLAVAPGLHGCGGGEVGGSGEGVELVERVDTVAGAPRVVTSGEARRWRLEEVLELGSVGSVGERADDEFGTVSSVAVGPGGNLWVADATNAEIRVFRPDGALERVVGRHGQGPGEFGSIYSIAWVGDVLLALDFANGRVAELSREGEWLGSRRSPANMTGSPSMLRLYAVAADEAYQWSFRVEPAFRRTWVVHRPEGMRGEFPQPDVRPRESATVVCDGGPNGTGFHSNPWAPSGYQHPAPGGRLWIGTSERYRLALVDSVGDTVRIAERDVPPAPVSDAEWAEAEADYEGFRETWREVSAECEGSFGRPERKPAFRNVLVDTGGRLWVERMLEDGTLWEVFDGEGHLLGAVPGFRYHSRTAPFVSEDHVAWVTRDTLLEVPRVHLGRLRAGS